MTWRRSAGHAPTGAWQYGRERMQSEFMDAHAWLERGDGSIYDNIGCFAPHTLEGQRYVRKAWEKHDPEYDRHGCPRAHRPSHARQIERRQGRPGPCVCASDRNAQNTRHRANPERARRALPQGVSAKYTPPCKPRARAPSTTPGRSRKIHAPVQTPSARAEHHPRGVWRLGRLMQCTGLRSSRRPRVCSSIAMHRPPQFESGPCVELDRTRVHNSTVSLG